MAFGGDNLLKSIGDWTQFDDKLKNDKTLQLPHIFLSEVVKNE